MFSSILEVFCLISALISGIASSWSILTLFIGFEERDFDRSKWIWKNIGFDSPIFCAAGDWMMACSLLKNHLHYYACFRDEKEASMKAISSMISWSTVLFLRSNLLKVVAEENLKLQQREESHFDCWNISVKDIFAI